MLNCCYGYSNHGSRKPENPRKFSTRTVTKKKSSNAFAPWCVGEVERSDNQLTRFLGEAVRLNAGLCLDENYTGAWTAWATKRTPKAAQTRLMVSKRG